jgi:hypothetical protein
MSTAAAASNPGRTRQPRTVRCVVAGAGLILLAACSSSLSGHPAALTTAISTSPVPTATVTTVVTATQTTTAPPSSAPASTSVAPVVDYGQQFLADVEPWNIATAALTSGDTLTSPAAKAAGQQAVAVARELLSQSWPTADQGDVHALAVEFDTLDADIDSNNLAKYRADGTSLNADANVVRAELGLAAVK